MAKDPVKIITKDEEIENAGDKMADKVAEATEDRPTGYAAVNGSMKVTAVLEDDKAGAPNGTMLYPITDATGPAAVGYSWSGEKYYPPAL